MRRRSILALLLSLATPGLGCGWTAYSAATWVAMPFLFEEAELPETQIVRDVPYRVDPEADPGKHHLDLFLPGAAVEPGWPTLVFVHGGGWTSGDKDLRAGGRDIYANIGRFYAARGIGGAIVSYRLQPGVDWRQQVDDVARAVAWVRDEIPSYGGDSRAVFVSGHSAGAQLATYVALDGARGNGAVCGVVAVSGAGFDLSDERTYDLGASRDYYEERFRDGDRSDAWMREGSAVRLARADAPPTLILYGAQEWPSLQRQAHVLDEALRAAGARSQIVIVPDDDHYRIVPTLSRPDAPASTAIEAFVRSTDCGGE